MSAAPAAGSADATTAAAAASSKVSAVSSSQPDFLTIILELDPRRLLLDPAAAQLLVEPNQSREDAAASSSSSSGNALTRYLLPALLIFLNAHIALQHGNGLAIYLATPTSPTRLVYTSAPGRLATSARSAAQTDARPDPNTYQHFGVVNRALWAAVRRAAEEAADALHPLPQDDDNMSDHSLPDAADAQRPRKRRRRRFRPNRTGTGPLVSALSQALAHFNNIPASSSSSSSSGQASNLPSGHSATILPRAQASLAAAKQGDAASVAGGGLPSWRPRILVLSTSEGGAGGTGVSSARGADPDAATQSEAMAYVPLMNCIFAAQKRGILIDVLKLTDGQDVVFLQQAAHLTGGKYLRLDLDEQGDARTNATRNGRPSRTADTEGKTASKPLSLLQVLMTTFLPPRDLRYFPPSLALSSAVTCSTAAASGGSGVGILRLPTLDSVDFRAACFCHRTVVDVGFVCSVCLSIFCEPRKDCIICGSRFPRATMRRFADEHKIAAALAQFAARNESESAVA